MICEKHNEEKVKQGKRLRCVSCNREQQRSWWNQNRTTQQQRVKKNRNRLSDVILEIKEIKKCLICGEDNPMVLEFDHIEPGDKKETISQMARVGVKPETIRQEIYKCRVLCSNCHQVKTHIENNSYTFKRYETDNRFKPIIEKIISMIENKQTN
jgi:hypothetical protein